jgi:phosphoribosylamine--glycine ligase
MPFHGCLYAGLMLTPNGPRVLEFNVRFGDPETQAIMPRFEGDLLDVLHRCAAGRMHEDALPVSGDACVSVVLAAAGYPDAPQQGAEITGIEQAEAVDGVAVFHAGTSMVDGVLRVSGGRVLNVSATGADLVEARERAYRSAGLISFEGRQLRTDIARAAAGVEQHA